MDHKNSVAITCPIQKETCSWVKKIQVQIGLQSTKRFYIVETCFAADCSFSSWRELVQKNVCCGSPVFLGGPRGSHGAPDPLQSTLPTAQLEHKWHFRLQGDLLGPFWDLNQSLQNAVSNNRCALQILGRVREKAWNWGSLGVFPSKFTVEHCTNTRIKCVRSKCIYSTEIRHCAVMNRKCPSIVAFQFHIWPWHSRTAETLRTGGAFRALLGRDLRILLYGHQETAWHEKAKPYLKNTGLKIIEKSSLVEWGCRIMRDSNE